MVHFYKKQSSGFVHHRLDCILISNILRQFVTMAEILTPISTNDSQLLFSLSKEKTQLEVKDFGNLIAL